MTHYECWTHRFGENYLVRLDAEDLVTGVCGPMRQDDIPAENMPNYDYEAQPRHAEWVTAHRAEFRRAGVAPPLPMD